MSAYLDECRRDLGNRNVLGLWALATLVAAISGPLGSYENCTFPHRLLLWGIWIGLFLVIAAIIRAFVHGILKLRDFSRGGPLIAALVAMLTSFPVNAMNTHAILGPEDGQYITASWGEIAAMVFLMSLTLAAYQSKVFGQTESAEVPKDAPEGTEAPRLLLRLDPSLRGELIAISVRNHYVDVLTTAGTGTLLMRFSDAIAEAAPVEGAQVHRSHWVAWDRVTGVARRGGKLNLMLGAHGSVPVSRNNRDKVEARGLI